MAARIAEQQQTAAPSQPTAQAGDQVRELPSTRAVLLSEFGDLVEHVQVPGVPGA
ncbi:hypothetical protein Aph01nite_43850 [Acrocarpospora phusangensis]|uniref:Uncharacterized protein n=2 Tax=Acrocarpospora phusangensis TaxID=1070424 RepID=A0A919US32_9ACTN|nr:hypothetical protein Aph01nite_43850 [Acrocarpospora phusangensis]